MAHEKYLTKSKFKLAMECPTKLFYLGKAEYANAKIEDSFLKSLADGGFQVGALARCYFPDGILVETPNDEVAAAATKQYLTRDKVTLFESVFKHENFLIRADVVVKNGSRIDLYEVKAKSCDFADQSGMLNKDGSIISKWQKYIEDAAFQKHVISLAFPEFDVYAHLMLTDKTSVCPTDGLNQKFRLVREEGRRRVQIADTLEAADLTPQLLRAIDVDETCEKLFASVIRDRRFDDYVAMLADSYKRDEKIINEPSKVCGECEFRLPEDDSTGTLLSGYRECWSESLNWADADFEEPTVLDVWDFRAKNKFIADRRIKFSDLTIGDIKPKPDGKPGISRAERQWMQIDLVQRNVTEPFIDRANLAREIESWTFPLHFIDFETSKPAIPFLKDQRPYGEVVFQFSHHTVDEAGNVRHAGEFLLTTPGTFPNFEFVRELKRQLDGDKGTVFKYTSFENTVLGSIRLQLLDNVESVPDAKELCVAHTFNEVGDFDVDGRKVRRIDASRIEETKSIRVVLFKMSLSTGWDCPRAEVMMSFRRAADHTYIAQLLGRMVRSPLARRIESDASLNDVNLYLPHFDQAAVDAIISDLKNEEDVPPTEIGTSKELVILNRRAGIDDIFAAAETLPTYRVDAVRKQSSLRRLMGLSGGLTRDGITTELLNQTKAEIVTKMNSEVERLKKSGELSARAQQITGIEIERVALQYGTDDTAEADAYLVEAASADIDRHFHQAGRTFGNGLHIEYWREQGDRDADEVKVETLVLANDSEGIRELERFAEQRFDKLYDQYKPEIAASKENRRIAFERLRLAAAEPKDIPWRLPDTIDFKRSANATEYDKHLYVENDGKFRADLGTWEREVIQQELLNPDVVGWLRNAVKKIMVT